MQSTTDERYKSTQAGEDTPHQQLTCRVCWLRDVICNEGIPFHQHCGVFGLHNAFCVPGDPDLWPSHSNSYVRRTKHVFHVNLAQIRSVVPAICCRIRVRRIERVSQISSIWRINGCQTITVNSRISGPKFTKFLLNVGRSSALLTRSPLSDPAIRCGMRVPRKAFRRFRA